MSRRQPGPKRRSVADAVDKGLKPDQYGSPAQRSVYNVQNLTYAQGVRKHKSWDGYCSMNQLWHHSMDVSPAKQAILFLSICVVARMCCSGSVVRTPMAFEGGLLTLDVYKALINVRNPFTGYSMFEIMPHLHLHPVYKDGGKDSFYNDGQIQIDSRHQAMPMPLLSSSNRWGRALPLPVRSWPPSRKKELESRPLVASVAVFFWACQSMHAHWFWASSPFFSASGYWLCSFCVVVGFCGLCSPM